MATKLRYKNSSYWGSLHFCVFYFLEIYQVVTVKYLLVLPGKKEPFLNKPEHSVLTKAYPLESIVNQSLTSWDFIRD